MNKTFYQRRSLLQLAGFGAVSGLLAPGLTGCITTDNTSHRWQGNADYQNSIVIDGLSAAFDRGVDAIDPALLATFKHSGITAVNATIPYPGDDYQQTVAKIDDTLAVIRKYPNDFRLIKTAADLHRAKAANQIGIIMGFQSTEMFGNDVSLINAFARMGVRIMQLSYNGPSQFGAGGLVPDNPGLSELGREAIQQMEASNVLVDLSHSGQQTVSDAIKQATRPLTISHTGCNSIYRHPRNNDDAELKAVADKDGVIGIYLMPFLEGGDGELTAEAFYRHLDYAINLLGADHVAIGSDQGIQPVADGPEYREMIRKEVERRIAAGISAPGETPNRPPFIPALNSERRMAMIAEGMDKRGYNAREIEQVIGENWLRLFKAVW